MTELPHPNAPPIQVGEIEERESSWTFAILDQGRRRLANLRYDTHPRAAHARSLMCQAIAEVDTGVRADAIAAQEPVARPPQTVGPRAWIHAILEEGLAESLPGRLLESFLVVLIVANVVAVALESIPSFNARFRVFFVLFEEFSLGIYAVEYGLRLWSSVEDPRVAGKGHGRIAFMLRPLMVVDFLAFAPSIVGIFFGIDLRVLRIFRLFRLLKLARYSQALQALLNVLFVERSALLASTILLLAVTCLFGELMHLAEGRVQPNTLGTMPGAMYWALTTLTTVGYGDVTPTTPLGKFIAGITMVTGLALFALPVGIIANGFVTGLSRRRFAITWNMLRRQPLFAGFDTDSLADVMAVPAATIVREHAHIAVAGKEARDFILIVSGEARAEFGDEERGLGPGDIIGAETLHHSGVYAQTVTARTETRIIAFAADELRRLCRKYPVLRERIEQALASDPAIGDGVGPQSRMDELERENARLRDALLAIALDRLSPANGPP